jgi:autotransporter adhesin
VAIGSDATAGATASQADAVAIGAQATAGAQAGDVALGSGSSTSAVVNTPSATINGTLYTFAGTNATSTVSVGGAGTVRTITNVAAGRIGPTSTDAINGSQLVATDQAIDQVGSQITNLGNTIASGLGGGTTYNSSTGAITTNLTFNSTTYTSVQGALNAINTGITTINNGGSGPVQYSNAGTPTTPNGGVPSQDLTLVGAALGPVGLHNVAPGSVASTSTDAVNGGQLNTGLSSVATTLGGGAIFDTATGQISKFSSKVGGVTSTTVGGALSALDATTQ